MANEYATTYTYPCGGVNNTAPDYAIADNELSACENYEPDTTGGGWLRKRAGAEQVGVAHFAANTYSLYQGVLGNYWVNGTKIYNLAGTQLHSGLTESSGRWASFGGYDLMVNGTDAVKTDDGSSFSAISGCPANALHIAAANQFCYVAGHDGGKLRWGDISSITFTATNELDLNASNGDLFRAIVPWRNGLLIVMQKSHGLLIGNSTVSQQISYWNYTVGAINSMAVATPVGAFWWGKDGLVWLKDDFSIDHPMQRKLLANYTTYYGLLTTDGYRIQFVWDDKYSRLFIFDPTATHWYMYYPYADAWYVHQFVGTSFSIGTGAAACIDVGSAQDIYVANSYYVAVTDAKLFKLSASTDDNTLIPAFAETKREGLPAVERMAGETCVTTNLASAADLTYSIYLDNQTSVTSGNSWTVTPGTGLVDTRLAVNRQHRRIKHRIYDIASSRTRILQLTHSGTIHRVRP